MCEKKSVQSFEDGAHSSYHHVGIVYCGRATEVVKQRLGGHRKLCAGNLMCSRFVAGICHRPFDNDKLCLRASGNAQMFQYGETILVRPIMKYSAQEEDGNIRLLRRLRVKEVVTLGTRYELAAEGRWTMKVKIDEPWILTRPDPSASGIFFFQNCHPYLVRQI